MIFSYEIVKGLSIGELLITVVILFAVLSVAKFISLRIRRIFKDKLTKEQMNFMLKLTNYGIITVYILVILTYFGVNFSGFLVAGGIAGIVIGFASQRIVGNLVSGIFLLIERPIKIGSDVNVEGFGGFVEDINVMSTIIRTYDGLYVRLPNEKVFMANIINNVNHKARRVDFLIGVDYKSDMKNVTAVLNEVVSNHNLVLSVPKPEIFTDRLSDSSVDVVIRVWSPINQWWDMKKQLLEKMVDALEKNNIVIPYPNRVLWIQNKD